MVSNWKGTVVTCFKVHHSIRLETLRKTTHKPKHSNCSVAYGIAQSVQRLGYGLEEEISDPGKG